MSDTFDTGRNNPLSFLVKHIPVPWVFVLGYLCGVGLEYVAPTPVALKAAVGIKLGGIALFVAGALIAGWGWATFRRARTTTVPGQASSQLVTWGPYRFGRNPMYVGLALAYLGEAAMLRQLWPLPMLALVLAYVNWVVIPIEERKLRHVFGERYDDYRRRVRRWV